MLKEGGERQLGLVWGQNDLEAHLLKLASIRQEYVRPSRQDFEESLRTKDPKYGKGAREYISWLHGFPERIIPEIALPETILLGDDWLKGIKAITSRTDEDGKERYWYFVADPKNLSVNLVHKDSWVGNSKSITLRDYLAFLRQTELDENKVVVGFGHTHPGRKHNRRTWKHYNRPESAAYFSPVDLGNILTWNFLPFHVVANGSKASLVFLTRDSRLSSQADLIEEFVRDSRTYVPKGWGEPKTFIQLLRDVSFLSVFVVIKPKKDFDMFDWNRRMAQRYGLALYQGRLEELTRVG